MRSILSPGHVLANDPKSQLVGSDEGLTPGIRLFFHRFAARPIISWPALSRLCSPSMVPWNPKCPYVFIVLGMASASTSYVRLHLEISSSRLVNDTVEHRPRAPISCRKFKNCCFGWLIVSLMWRSGDGQVHIQWLCRHSFQTLARASLCHRSGWNHMRPCSSAKANASNRSFVTVRQWSKRDR